MSLLSEDKIKAILNIQFKFSDILPSDFASNRWMESSESNFKGKFNYDRTPYMREVIDFFSPYSPINIQSLLKGHQLGGNATFENGICYRISESPANIMLVSANAGLAEKAMLRIDKAIDGFGIRHLMRAQTKGATKRTGDKAGWKEFAGGSLISFGGQSLSNMRSNPVQIVIADECDTYKMKDVNAGSFVKVMEDRTSSFGANRKIFFLSTPLLKGSSIIEMMFQKGDERYWNMPCPCCGEYITYEWYGKREDGLQYGIMYDVKDGMVVKKSVRYVCQKCGNHFFEARHKTDMLMAGNWIPTSTPIADTYRSHCISSLYAPVGMRGWYDYAIQFNDAHPRGGKGKPEELQSFNNSVLAKTWENKGKTLQASKVQNNIRQYDIKTVPFEMSEKDGNGSVVLLTCGCDLNGIMSGSRGATEDDVRLDYEIVAWTEKGNSYSVDQGSIGTFINERLKPKNYDENRLKYTYAFGSKYSVWDEFKAVLDREYSGYPINITGVDVGNFTAYANDFVYSLGKSGYNIIPIKGDKPDAFRATQDDKAWYRKSKEVEGLHLANVNVVKDYVAELMDLPMYENDEQPIGFMNFPTPAEGKYSYKNYFAHWEGEHRKIKDGASGLEYYIWERISGKQNHFWDCRIYNEVLRWIAGQQVCDMYKQSRKKTIEPTWANISTLFKLLT